MCSMQDASIYRHGSTPREAGFLDVPICMCNLVHMLQKERHDSSFYTPLADIFQPQQNLQATEQVHTKQGQ